MDVLVSGDSGLHVIHLTSKPNIKDKKILLQWSLKGVSGFYIIERSNNQKDFEMIGVIKVGCLDNSFEFVDEKPAVIRNYYRIKMQDHDGRNFYSNTLSAGMTDSTFCKFYPNPVDKLLILRSVYSAVVKISDLTGKPRIIQQLKPGLQTMDVSCLEKNLYIITIYDEESKLFITNKLIKN